MEVLSSLRSPSKEVFTDSLETCTIMENDVGAPQIERRSKPQEALVDISDRPRHDSAGTDSTYPRRSSPILFENSSLTPHFVRDNTLRTRANGDESDTTTLERTPYTAQQQQITSEEDTVTLQQSSNEQNSTIREFMNRSQAGPNNTAQAAFQQSNTASLQRTQSSPVDQRGTSTVQQQQQQQRDKIEVDSGFWTAMGYTNTGLSTPPRWGEQDASAKMGSSTSSNTRTRDNRRDHEDDGQSIESYEGSNLSTPPSHPQQSPAHVDIESVSSARMVASTFGTPSTVSTVPSTDADDASAEGLLDRISLRLDEAASSPYLAPRGSDLPYSVVPAPGSHNAARMPSSEQREAFHRRSNSWGETSSTATRRFAPPMVHPGPEGGAQQHPGWGQPAAGYNMPRGTQENPWGQPTSTTPPRIASFLGSENDAAAGKANDPRMRYGFEARQGLWRQQRPPFAEQQQHQISHPQQHGQQLNVDGRGGVPYRHSGYNAYQGQGQMGYGHPPPHAQTPPRAQNPRQQVTGRLPASSPSAPGGGGGPSQQGQGAQRSQAEVLKTLLRKKACLYEPETSRAVALIAWLVGRELALEYGYFSRQQLQAGVHTCVTRKIESGTITRTKVNRCMQIILNSCFHYIIPRPDGSEEKGDAFRSTFAATVKDDRALLSTLAAPWDNLTIDRETILQASLEDALGKQKVASPSGSPRVGSMPAPDGDGDTKRAVLLGFNENVRSAEDVFRCHNEFIRDTANASKLHLSAQEWRSFFGKDSTDSPLLWGSVGMSPSSKVPGDGSTRRRPDFFGEMSASELSQFRTTWCAKRYDHDHDLCGFSHVEVSGGWLRRDPSIYSYSPEVCPSVRRVVDKRLNPSVFFVNDCELGRNCPNAHSTEEVLYHPKIYKSRICPSQSSRGNACRLVDVCPNLHKQDSSYQQPPKRRGPGEGRGQQRHARQGSPGRIHVPPEGSPMLYLKPSPLSSFEEHLGMPGLQSLFRRNCAVTGAYLRPEKITCRYTNFGDDCSIINGEVKRAPPRGLPPPRRV